MSLNRIRKSTPQDQCRYIPQYHLGVPPGSFHYLLAELQDLVSAFTATCTTTTTTLESALDFQGLYGRLG